MRRDSSRNASRHPDEWVGGYFTLDSRVTGEGPPYHPSLVVWIDPDGPFVVKGEVVRPGEEPDALVKILGKAFAAPDVGPPRLPARVRVSEEDVARRVREQHAMATVVGPTPEIDDIRRAMADFEAQRAPRETVGSEEDTYLPTGASPALVASVFSQAQALHRLAPWKHAADEDAFAVDAPELGIRGGVLSLIGSLGESTGFLLFASAAAFRTFYLTASARLPGGQRGAPPAIDFGSEVLSLTFERGSEIPKRMRGEVAKHGWPLASPEAYPRVERRDRTGEPLPTTVVDLRMADSIAGLLVAFAARHGSEIGAPTEVISMESQGDPGPAMVLTYPHPELLEGFDEETMERERLRAPAKRTPVGRNQPCPCGSGLKYKRCCLRNEENQAAKPSPALFEPKDLDPELIAEMLRFGRARFPDGLARAQGDYGLADDADPIHLQLFTPWVVYSYRIADGMPLAAHYLRQRGARLGADERTWLEAQLRAHLTVWEVEEVRRGEGVTVLDLLTGTRREVLERRGSEHVLVRDGLLARVVFDGTVHRFFGMYPAALPPRQTATVIKKVAELAGWPSLPVDDAALASTDAAHALVHLWRQEERAIHEAPPVELRNTDGDVLVMVEDSYGLGGRTPREVVAALANNGFEREPDVRGVGRLRLNKRKRGGPLESVNVATVHVHEDRVTIETNSRKRASATRRKMTAALGGELPHLRRSEAKPSPARTDLVSAHDLRAEVSPGRSDVSTEQAHALVRGFKADHWRRWVDEPIPALGGVTPRQAAASAQGRAEVVLLLKEAERYESAQEPVARFDLSIVRRELGLS